MTIQINPENTNTKNPIKRILNWILSWFKIGVTPQKMALALSLGICFGVFPIIGFTSVLCGIAAVWFRLNMAIIQVVNYMVYPLQFIFIIPFIRMGEWIFNQPPMDITLDAIISIFQSDLTVIIETLWFALILAISGWALVTPIAFAVFYFTLRTILSRIFISRLSA